MTSLYRRHYSLPTGSPLPTRASRLRVKIMSKFKCVSCGSNTSQFTTDDGEYYYPQCGECN